MKNKKITDIIFYTALLAAWLLSGFRMLILTETAILSAAFLSSLAVFTLIKNTKVKIILTAMITAAAGIYTYEYILLYVPVLLLFVMIVLEDDGQKKKLCDICGIVYIALTVFKIIYTIYIKINSVMYINGRFTFYLKVSAIPLIFFLLLFIVSCIRDKDGKGEAAEPLRKAFAFSAAGIFLDTVLLSIKNVYGDLQAAQFDFFAWLILAVCVLYFRDRSAERILNYINRKTEHFLGIER